MRSGGGAFRDPPTGNHEVAQNRWAYISAKGDEDPVQKLRRCYIVQVLAVEKVPVAHHVIDNISGWSERLHRESEGGKLCRRIDMPTQ